MEKLMVEKVTDKIGHLDLLAALEAFGLLLQANNNAVFRYATATSDAGSTAGEQLTAEQALRQHYRDLLDLVGQQRSLVAALAERAIELADVREWADGVKAALSSELADRVTDEEVAVAHAVIQGENLYADANRYRYLRGRNLDAIEAGGIFAGMTQGPEGGGQVLNGETLDKAIDSRLNTAAPAPKKSAIILPFGDGGVRG
jgi:hypothetical protein